MNFKKITIAALLVLPFIAACSGGNSYKETRSEEELINELSASAISEIGVGYTKFASDGVAFGETKLTMTVNQKVWEGDEFGLNFSLEYSLAAQESYTSNYLMLGQDGDSLLAELVVARDLEGYDIASALNAAAYTLSAKLTFDGYAEGFVAPKGLKTTDSFKGKVVATKSWNALVKAAESGTLDEVRKAAKGSMVFTSGIVTAAYDWSYDEIFRGVIIADGTSGALLYSGCLQTAFYDDANSAAKIKVGDVVEVYGEVSPYNGLFEIRPQVVRVTTDAATVAALHEPTFRTVTADEVAASKQENTGDLVRVEGLKLKAGTDIASLVVGKDEKNEYHHWTLTCVDSGDKEVQIYVNYHIGEDAQNAIKTLLSGLNGGTFTFQGILSAYNAMQLTPMATKTNAGSCFVAD